MTGEEVPLFPIVILGVGILVVLGAIFWAERASAPPHFRKLADQPPPSDHVCPLPWWRPFRKVGERIECVACGDTWRWGYPTTYTRDGGGHEWVSERDEANHKAH